MIWTISEAEYAFTGLGSCCTYEPVVEVPYCGVAGVIPLGLKLFIPGESEFVCASGTMVPGATGDEMCNVGSPTGTDCSAFPDSVYVGVNSIGGYVSSGSCTIEVTAEPECGCPNSLPITQSIDVCDLAASAWEQLNPNVLNMFGSPCDA